MINFYNQQNKHSENSNIDKKDSKEDSSLKKAGTKKYYDPTGEFGSKQFKWAVLFITNKLVLYKILISVLTVFGTITIGFSLWKIVNFIIYDVAHKPRAEYELTRTENYANLRINNAPAQLQILNSYSLVGGIGKVDALSEIINPNKQYKVSFDYYFDFNGVVTEVVHENLLPLENRPIVIFGLDSSVFIGNPTIVIQNVRWNRISAHEVVDNSLWQKERLDFAINNFIFVMPSTADTASANSIQFSIKNNSSYSYLNPLFYLGLYQNSLLVGIMKFDLVDFNSLESRNIDIRNFVENLHITDIELYPIIDVYNKDAYIKSRI